MGGDLLTRGTKAPSFPGLGTPRAQSAPLARLQVIKASVRDGKAEERVFDIACPGGAAVDPESHRCPESTASVDLTSCALAGDGAASLQARWSDPDYRPGETAMYVRALENPSCRWSTWDTPAPVTPNRPCPSPFRSGLSPIWLSAAAQGARGRVHCSSPADDLFGCRRSPLPSSLGSWRSTESIVIDEAVTERVAGLWETQMGTPPDSETLKAC